MNIFDYNPDTFKVKFDWILPEDSVVVDSVRRVVSAHPFAALRIMGALSNVSLEAAVELQSSFLREHIHRRIDAMYDVANLKSDIRYRERMEYFNSKFFGVSSWRMAVRDGCLPTTDEIDFFKRIFNTAKDTAYTMNAINKRKAK